MIRIMQRAAIMLMLALLPAAAVRAAPDPYSRAGSGGEGGYTARQLVDQLYTPPGAMPIRDLIIEATVSEAVEASGNLLPSGTDRMYYKYPNKLRLDTVFRDPGGPLDGKQAVIIRDGTNRWMFVSTGQYPVKKGSDEPSPTLNLPYAIQKYPQNANDEYRLAGAALVDGVKVEVVEVVSPARPDVPTRVWIDPTRRVPLRLEVTVPPANPEHRPVVKTVHYRDIRELPDGRFFPFRLEIYENDVLTRVLAYKGVKVNAGLQDSLFEPMSRFVR